MLSDDELDEYVASLLTSKAQRQSAAYSTLGFRAFLKDTGKDGPVGKPNTRFLKNIVRDVDGFNAALARREERESRERLKDLRKRDGEKLHGYKERSSRRDDDWRERRERDRSRSLSPHRRRDRDGEEKDRRRRSRRDDSPEEERRERRHGESRKRRSRHEESEIENDRSRKRREHRERHRHSDDEGRQRCRDHDDLRHSKGEAESSRRDRTARRSEDIKEGSRQQSKTKASHSSSKRDLSRRSRRHGDSPDSSSGDESKHKSKSHTSRPRPISDSASSIGPGSPVHGPEFRIAKGRGKMNGGTLDAKFSDTYDPRKDTPDEDPDNDDDTDDWGVALRALRERQSFILSGAMTERLAQTKNESQPSGWPTYSKGEREWDKGKVVLDDGSVGVKVWGVEKTL